MRRALCPGGRPLSIIISFIESSETKISIDPQTASLKYQPTDITVYQDIDQINVIVLYFICEYKYKTSI